MTIVLAIVALLIFIGVYLCILTPLAVRLLARYDMPPDFVLRGYSFVTYLQTFYQEDDDGKAEH